MPVRGIFAAVLVGWLGIAQAQADEYELNYGKTIQGKVIFTGPTVFEPDPEKRFLYYILTEEGTIHFVPKGAIKSHREGPAELPSWDDKVSAPPNAVSFQLTVTIQADADETFLNRFKERMCWANQVLFQVSGGQIYISHFDIQDNKKGGHIRVVDLDKELLGKGGGATVTGIGSPGAYMTCAGRIEPPVWVHEFGHLRLGLPDEYTSEPVCRAPCLMGRHTKDKEEGKEFARNGLQFCDASNCDKPQAKWPSCWDRIVKKFPGLRLPTKKYNEVGRAPIPTFTIENTGKK